MLQDSGDHAAAEEMKKGAVPVGSKDDVIRTLGSCLVDNFVHRDSKAGLAGNIEAFRTKRGCQMLKAALRDLGLLPLNIRRGCRDNIHGNADRNVGNGRFHDMEQDHPGLKLRGKGIRMLQDLGSNLAGINRNEECNHSGFVTHRSLACEKNPQ